MSFRNPGKYVRKFPRENLEKGWYHTEQDSILIPQSIYKQSKELVKRTKEVGGMIIAQPKQTSLGTHYLCEHLTFLDKGEFVYYEFKNKRADAIKGFLEKHNELQGIEFHVHPAQDKWSFGLFDPSDLGKLSRSIGCANPYMHLLFTEKNIVCFGLNKPRVRLYEANEREITEKGREYEIEIQHIKTKLPNADYSW